MAGNSSTADDEVLEDNTETLDNQDVTSREDEQPLLKEPGVFSRLLSVRVLLLCILVLVLAGGAGVGTWLLIGVSSSGGGGGGGSPDTPFHLVDRTTWGARKPKNGTNPFPHPPATHAVIISTEGVACNTQEICSAEVRDIQSLHMDKNKFSDIGYNFLVGGDGQTYEGRGWDTQGAFAKGYNDESLGIAFIGTFIENSPPKQQLEEAQALLAVSVEKKKLATNYTLVGHQQVSHTSSPGDALFNIIKTWPHWKDCYMTTC